ncbi:MAG: copper resistance protein CopC [Beijerinckiaceae bacterium]|nr:copper resistance protein CopC [Beijerinckiaceae bacterium]
MSKLASFGALALFLAGTAPAFAHAILVESKPAASGVVDAGEIAVQLRFNSRIDKDRSQVSLLRPDRSRDVVPISSEGGADMLGARLTLTPGKYTLRWQVLAVDGHITRGDLPFTVRGQAGK